MIKKALLIIALQTLVLLSTLPLSAASYTVGQEFGDRSVGTPNADNVQTATLTPSRLKTGLHFLVSHSENNKVVCDYSFNEGLPSTVPAGISINDIGIDAFTQQDHYSVSQPLAGAVNCIVPIIIIIILVGWQCNGGVASDYEGDYDMDKSYMHTVPIGCDSKDTDWNHPALLKQQ